MEGRGALLGATLLGSLLVAAGCAMAPRTAVPPDLPHTTQEQFLTLRWALVRESASVRAVGLAESTAGNHWDATVSLEGLDGQGRTVSRDSTIIRPGFGTGPTVFEVALVPTGGETEFRLSVVHAQQFSRPSR